MFNRYVKFPEGNPRHPWPIFLFGHSSSPCPLDALLWGPLGDAMDVCDSDAMWIMGGNSGTTIYEYVGNGNAMNFGFSMRIFPNLGWVMGHDDSGLTPCQFRFSEPQEVVKKERHPKVQSLATSFSCFLNPHKTGLCVSTPASIIESLTLGTKKRP